MAETCTCTIVDHANNNITEDIKKCIQVELNHDTDFDGNIQLNIQDKIEVGNIHEYITCPMYLDDGTDCGYLHVYGLREVQE